MNKLTYPEFQRKMASYGFIICPLSEQEYERAVAHGCNDNTIYGVACDVNAGIGFERALQVNCEDYDQ